mgnify:CR=1 FL=1
MKEVVISESLLLKISDVLDNLIQIIDHDRDAIDDFTTVLARKLLQKIPKITEGDNSKLNGD